jgi:hypothetical protein
MRKVGIALAVAAAIGACYALTTPTQATPVGLSSRLVSDADLNIVQKAQFMYNGRNYCWYDGGWHGPGWYWCGYAFNTGFGWGGPMGWHNWHGVGRSFHGGVHVYRGHVGRGHHH